MFYLKKWFSNICAVQWGLTLHDGWKDTTRWTRINPGVEKTKKSEQQFSKIKSLFANKFRIEFPFFRIEFPFQKKVYKMTTPRQTQAWREEMYNAFYVLVLSSSTLLLSHHVPITLLDQGVKVARLDPKRLITIRDAEGRLRLYFDITKTSRLAKSDENKIIWDECNTNMRVKRQNCWNSIVLPIKTCAL